MKKVRLYTNDGRFVAEVEILPFSSPPEVLVWGERLFVRRCGLYCEAADIYYVPTEVPRAR